MSLLSRITLIRMMELHGINFQYEFNFVVYKFCITLKLVNLHTAETMICAYHLLGPKHGLHHLDIEFWINGGLGSLTPKLLGKIHNLASVCFVLKPFQCKPNNGKCVQGNSQMRKVLCKKLFYIEQKKS